jgi:hypothetical protein
VADFLTSAHTESLKLSEAVNTVKTAGFLWTTTASVRE